MFIEYYDISVPLQPETLVYPGDLPFRRRCSCDMEHGDAYRLSELSLSAHSGTHLDAPSHFISDGRNIAEIPVERFILPALVHQTDTEQEIGAEELESLSLKPGKALLFKTRNSTSGLVRKGPFREKFVSLGISGAEFCVERKLSLVGIDYLSIESGQDESYPVHHLLLANNILILEGIDLANVPPGKFTLICFPLKISGAEASPVRAVLVR